jgi:hypothetical protein
MLFRRLGPFSRFITNSASAFVYKAAHQFRLAQSLKVEPLSGKRANRRYLYCAVGGIFVARAFSDDEDMAPLELAGRPDNLTEEQEVKLKEMWTVAFKVFGVPLENGTEMESTPTVDLPRTDTDVSDTKKEKKGGKKLTSVFKKKIKDKEANSSPSPSQTDISNLQIADGDDKYSQTKEFREALASSSPQEIRDTFWKMVKADHPDALFLRFLRARKWDVDKAVVMLIATMKWRTEPDIDVSLTITKD